MARSKSKNSKPIASDTARIRTLIPPGGFNNEVGHHLAALDVGLDLIRASADGAGNGAIPPLKSIGELERAWVHEAIGDVPTPAAPDDSKDVDAWLGWLDSVRTVTVMVLRSLSERDLERLIEIDGKYEIDGENDAAPRTVKRVLAELLFRQGVLAGSIK